MSYGIEQFTIIREESKNHDISALAEAMIFLAQSIRSDFDKVDRQIKGLEQKIKNVEARVRKP